MRSIIRIVFVLTFCSGYCQDFPTTKEDIETGFSRSFGFENKLLDKFTVLEKSNIIAINTFILRDYSSLFQAVYNIEPHKINEISASRIIKQNKLYFKNTESTILSRTYLSEIYFQIGAYDFEKKCIRIYSTLDPDLGSQNGMFDKEYCMVKMVLLKNIFVPKRLNGEVVLEKYLKASESIVEKIINVDNEGNLGIYVKFKFTKLIKDFSEIEPQSDFKYPLSNSKAILFINKYDNTILLESITN